MAAEGQCGEVRVTAAQGTQIQTQLAAASQGKGYFIMHFFLYVVLSVPTVETRFLQFIFTNTQPCYLCSVHIHLFTVLVTLPIGPLEMGE